MGHRCGEKVILYPIILIFCPSISWMSSTSSFLVFTTLLFINSVGFFTLLKPNEIFFSSIMNGETKRYTNSKLHYGRSFRMHEYTNLTSNGMQFVVHGFVFVLYNQVQYVYICATQLKRLYFDSSRAVCCRRRRSFPNAVLCLCVCEVCMCQNITSIKTILTQRTSHPKQPLNYSKSACLQK